MTEETFNIMPGETKGVLLNSNDKFEIFSSSPEKNKRVLIDTKMVPSGEWMHTFTNNKDSAILLKITRSDKK